MSALDTALLVLRLWLGIVMIAHGIHHWAIHRPVGFFVFRRPDEGTSTSPRSACRLPPRAAGLLAVYSDVYTSE